MSFTIAGHTFFATTTATAPTTATPKPPKESAGEKIGDVWAGLKDVLGLGGVNRAAKTAFIKFDTNKTDGLEAAEFGTIGAVMGQGPTAFGNAVKGNQDSISLGAFKSYVKRSFADEFKSIDNDKDGIIAGNELQSLAQRFPNTATGTWDSANTGYVTERRYMQARANQLAAA